MAAGDQWWVIASTQFGQKPSYNFFQGTEQQARDLAKRVMEVSGQPSVSGPYPSREAAQKAVAAGKVNTPGIPGGYQQQPGIGNPLAALGTLEAFYRTLTDGKLWRSLAWILLGILLIFTGVGLWIGPAAARRSPAGLAAGFAQQAYG